MKDPRFKVIEYIINIIKNSSFAEHTESYEIMPVIDNTELMKSFDSVDNEDYQSLLVSMAIVYVNIGMLCAKNILNENEFENFRIWFQIDYDKYVYDDCGFFMVNVCFTKDFKRCFSACQLRKIQLTDCELFPLQKSVKGIDSFVCYKQQFETIDKELITYYHFFGQEVVQTELCQAKFQQ